MLSYLAFHLVFILPLATVLFIASLTRQMRLPRARTQWIGIGIIAVVALVYTTPWDNYLIGRGVWSYGEGVVAVRFWRAPLGEYLFFVVQPVITALWLFQFHEGVDRPLAVSPGRRVFGALAGLAIGGIGAWLFFADDRTLYLGALLAWAGPVLAIQWAFGWPYLWAQRRTIAIGVGLPTLYLVAADAIALILGIWELSPTYTTGLGLAGVPIEEVLFFFVTNLFVVQGLVLWLWLTDQLERDAATAEAGAPA